VRKHNSRCNQPPQSGGRPASYHWLRRPSYSRPLSHRDRGVKTSPAPRRSIRSDENVPCKWVASSIYSRHTLRASFSNRRRASCAFSGRSSQIVARKKASTKAMLVQFIIIPYAVYAILRMPRPGVASAATAWLASAGCRLRRGQMRLQFTSAEDSSLQPRRSTTRKPILHPPTRRPLTVQRAILRTALICIRSRLDRLQSLCTCM